MSKSAVDTQHLSPDAREWLAIQMAHIERHVIARAGLLAAQSYDDVVLPSHFETAWNEVLGRRLYKKQLGIAITGGALLGGAVSALFGGMGKAIGEYLLKLFR